MTRSLAAVVVLLAACASSGDAPPEGPLGPGMKTVTSKEAPSTLVAMDGTICNVTPRKYEATKIGEDAWCDWRSQSEGPRLPHRPLGTDGRVRIPGG